jgi:RNA recognition motif-containing protein
MGTRLYVGNLPYETNENDLRSLFEADGRTVTQVSIVTDRDTGQPRGFAFVEMANQNDAQAAISALNGQELGGRSLSVNEARERTSSGGGGRRY